MDGFLERELADRRELGYPPFSRVALVRVDAVDETRRARGMRSAGRDGARAASPSREGRRVDVLGPAPAPIARVRNRFRFRVMLRSRRRGRRCARSSRPSTRRAPSCRGTCARRSTWTRCSSYDEWAGG